MQPIEKRLPPPAPPPVAPKPPDDGVQIKWKDGLPDDPFERMQIETGLIAAGLTSKFSALMRLLDGDTEAAKEELKRIEDEQRQNMMQEAALTQEEVPPEGEASQSGAQLAKMRAERGQGGTASERSGQNPSKPPPSS